ncbi:hypothetical protein EV356DRAFT_506659 [Viridothelium virens]|uniref:Uncharacterized protein n=1 Tax=Viridothelium virens TaxID=1048519 RepID=A0A6A6H0M0_VIRVR|nr:hypothetical protein EV356DRAFT_506659 [Viridothelium virens]
MRSSDWKLPMSFILERRDGSSPVLRRLRLMSKGNIDVAGILLRWHIRRRYSVRKNILVLLGSCSQCCKYREGVRTC